MAKPICILILGMHRSGTSALTKGLSLFGLDLPQDLLDKSKDNPHGYWESRAVIQLNDEILQSAKSNLLDYHEFPSSWYEQEQYKIYKEQAVKILKDNFSSSEIFLLKDPRICKLTSFWLRSLQAFGAEVRAVIPFRNPLEVVASMQARGIYPKIAEACWLRYVIDAEYRTRHMIREFFPCEYLFQEGNYNLLKELLYNLKLSSLNGSKAVRDELASFIKKEDRHYHYDAKDLQMKQEYWNATKIIYNNLESMVHRELCKEQKRTPNSFFRYQMDLAKRIFEKEIYFWENGCPVERSE